jgi:hypothetical protein
MYHEHQRDLYLISGGREDFLQKGKKLIFRRCIGREVNNIF